MRKGYIIINGNLSVVPLLKEKIGINDLLVCADGAAEHIFKQQLIPDVIIGDLDSIPPEIEIFYKKKEVTFIRYPREKDYTDTELAVKYAINNGAEELVICGLLGDRLDHVLANIFYLAKIAQKRPCCILEQNSSLYIIDDLIELKGDVGDELSLIPLRNCKGVKTTGLYYPLHTENLQLGSTRGISNVFIRNEITVEIMSGTLLVVHRALK